MPEEPGVPESGCPDRAESYPAVRSGPLAPAHSGPAVGVPWKSVGRPVAAGGSGMLGGCAWKSAIRPVVASMPGGGTGVPGGASAGEATGAGQTWISMGVSYEEGRCRGGVPRAGGLPCPGRGFTMGPSFCGRSPTGAAGLPCPWSGSTRGPSFCGGPPTGVAVLPDGCEAPVVGGATWLSVPWEKAGPPGVSDPRGVSDPPGRFVPVGGFWAAAGFLPLEPLGNTEDGEPAALGGFDPAEPLKVVELGKSGLLGRLCPLSGFTLPASPAPPATPEAGKAEAPGVAGGGSPGFGSGDLCWASFGELSERPNQSYMVGKRSEGSHGWASAPLPQGSGRRCWSADASWNHGVSLAEVVSVTLWSVRGT